MADLPYDGVRLREFTEDDTDDLAAGCNDPLTQRFLPLLPGPYTLDDARWWIKEGAPRAFSDGGGAYAFADPHTDSLLGGGGYGRVHEGSAELGYWVAPWARHRGVATAALRQLTTRAFETGLARLTVHTEPENTPSQRVAIAAGYTRECVQRGGGASRGGGRHDLIVWARLAGDPPGPSHRALPDLPGGELSDGVVRLRPLGPADVDDTLAIRSLPEVIETSVPPTAPDRATIERRCALAESDWLAGDRADFTIRDAATDAYAGDIGLYYWQRQTGGAIMGYSMMPAWRGRGYATRATVLVARWAFEHVGLHRLVAGTNPTNVASQRVLERAGFTREGYERSRLPGRDGTWIDNVVFVMLPPDPPIMS